LVTLGRIDDNDQLDLEMLTDVLKKVVTERLGPTTPSSV
jgi:hypothetical protein